MRLLLVNFVGCNHAVPIKLNVVAHRAFISD